MNVAIHSGHEIIDTGPYRFIRHPSYAGALLAFLGLGLCLANWWSLALVMAPILWAFGAAHIDRRVGAGQRARRAIHQLHEPDQAPGSFHLLI